MPTFGEHIKTLRLKRSESLVRIADFIDMKPKLLSQIEMGKRYATKDQVLTLANYLNINVSHLLRIYLKERIAKEQSKKSSNQRLNNLTLDINRLKNQQIQTVIKKPPPLLSKWISQIVYYADHYHANSIERILPDGNIQLEFNLDGKSYQPKSKSRLNDRNSSNKAMIKGAQEQYTVYHLPRHVCKLLVQFAPGGFYSSTNIPATEIKNSFVDASLLLGNSVLDLREQLLHCRHDIKKMICLVEDYFLHKFSKEADVCELTAYLTKHIELPLPSLVQTTGYTHKHVIHLFKKNTGISPKYFQRINRFNKTVHDILSLNGEVNWSDITFKQDFYDQSHFIKEFRHFSGLNPESYLQTGSTCSRLIHMNSSR